MLRHTVGYQNQFGGRRKSAPLSHSFLAQKTNLSEGRRLTEAIQRATDAGYVRRVSPGSFGPGVEQPKATAYAVCWLHDEAIPVSGSKRPVEERFKKASSQSVQRSPQEQSKNASEDSPETPVEERFKKASVEKKEVNNTNKQQVVVASFSKSIDLLTQAGFDRQAAEGIAQLASFEEIQRQIGWLPLRNPGPNKLGLLRRSIEGKWSAPAAEKEVTESDALRHRREQEQQKIDQEKEVLAQRSAERQERLKRYHALSPEEQIQLFQQFDGITRSLIERNSLRNRDFNNPPPRVLSLLSV